MTSDFAHAEAQRQREIASQRKREVRTRKRAQFREKASSNIRQWLKSLGLIVMFTLALTHRTELQQFVSLTYNQFMAGRGETDSPGVLKQSALAHEAEVNQASQ
jgi:hypothetical protein